MEAGMKQSPIAPKQLFWSYFTFPSLACEDMLVGTRRAFIFPFMMYRRMRTVGKIKVSLPIRGRLSNVLQE